MRIFRTFSSKSEDFWTIPYKISDKDSEPRFNPKVATKITELAKQSDDQ